MSISKGGI